MKISRLNASAFALALFAAIPASASSVAINFDDVTTGATANSAALPENVSFYQAIYANDLDEYGNDIPNTEKFRMDNAGDATPVTVENPLLSGYGNAPSGSNALDARWQPVLMHFNSAQNLNSFSVTLDNSSFGDLAQSSLYFLDASKTIISQINFDQTILGLIINLDASLANVQDILLPSGAFYDNITYSSESVSTVPLPPTFTLLLSALGVLGAFKRFRKSA